MVSIRVFTDEAKNYATKLKMISKTALPNAVRETLNKTALNVKQKTMPKESGRVFTNRQKNFFKANSSVDFAKKGRIDSMRSMIGFTENKLKGGDNFAVKDLEQQEYGGKIGGRKFIPLDSARSGGSRGKLVKRAIPKVSEMKGFGIVWAGASRGRGKSRIKSKKQRWIRAAFRAGVGGFVMGNLKAGRQTLSRIDSISSNRKSGKLEIKRTAVYSYKRGGIKPVKSRGFMRRASMEAGLNMNDVFINEARARIQKMMNQ